MWIRHQLPAHAALLQIYHNRIQRTPEGDYVYMGGSHPEHFPSVTALVQHHMSPSNRHGLHLKEYT